MDKELGDWWDRLEDSLKEKFEKTGLESEEIVEVVLDVIREDREKAFSSLSELQGEVVADYPPINAMIVKIPLKNLKDLIEKCGVIKVWDSRKFRAEKRKENEC